MKPLARILVLFAAVMVFGASGCSRAIYVRVFNRTAHTIRLLGAGSDAPVDIPAGASACVLQSSITRGRDHGFAIMDSGIERFYVVASQYRGLMELVGYFHEYYPGLGFEASTIQRLAALGVEIDCDFYYLAQPDGTDNSGAAPRRV